MEQVNVSSDFSFNITHQEKYSRGELLLRSFFGVLYMALPHLLILFFMMIAGAVVAFCAFWIVLFTAQYPPSFFRFQVSLLRWATRLNARLFHLVDGYPAFGTEVHDPKIILNLVYPEKLSRGLLFLRFFFGFLYVLIPHGICLFFRMIAVYVVIFIAWWAVLFTGEYPKGMHEFVVGTLRWAARVNIYMSFLTDKYPPFTGK